MKFLVYISDYMLPFVVFYIVGRGLLERVNVYDAFVEGAKQGLKTVVQIVPTLVGLMVAIGILRASGALDFVAKLAGPLAEVFRLPSELLPLILIKMFSSSAATSLLLDLYKQFGPDSSVGMTASILMSCSETIFYTMSVYFMTAKVRKSRYTLTGALLATAAGIGATLFVMGI
jgi:spore maturation protein B